MKPMLNNQRVVQGDGGIKRTSVNNKPPPAKPKGKPAGNDPKPSGTEKKKG